MALMSRPRRPMRPVRPKRQSFDPEFIAGLNYKSASQLRRFISERGKILGRRHTGLTAKQQRHVARQVRLARQMGLLHYTTDQLR
jgi:small subunit ribosomal protein S18